MSNGRFVLRILAVTFVIVGCPPRGKPPGGESTGGISRTDTRLDERLADRTAAAMVRVDTTRMAEGTIISLTATTLVLRSQREPGCAGCEPIVSEVPFALDSATVKEGELRTGAWAIVRFIETPKQHTAVWVRVQDSVRRRDVLRRP